MSGVKIGDGAVIASNSHIVKNVDPYTVVGGNPGELIKKRFSDEDIERLLKLKWWDMEDDIINEISPLLCSSNLEELFKMFNV
jgi:serine acetyltransferase